MHDHLIAVYLGGIIVASFLGVHNVGYHARVIAARDKLHPLGYQMFLCLVVVFEICLSLFWPLSVLRYLWREARIWWWKRSFPKEH